jgi:hypothetical protein
MSGDILHHKPARLSTVIPGHWLINLPPDTPIYIQRYRSLETAGDSREQSLLEDPIEVQWRRINFNGHGTVRDVLEGGCATIVHGASGTSEQERELWIFSTTRTPTESIQALERKSTSFVKLTYSTAARPVSHNPCRTTRMFKTRIQYLMPCSTIYQSTTYNKLRCAL